MPIPTLHIYVNDIYPNQLSVSALEKKWTLSLPHVKDFLEFLDVKVGPGCALIDGYEPLLYEKPLLHLIALLRLYGWDPSATTRGVLFSQLENPAEKLETLYRAGLTCLQLCLNGALLKTFGLEGLKDFYRLMKKSPIPIASYYQFTEDSDSSIWLQHLMHDVNFNQINHMLFINSQKNQKIMPMNSEGEFHREIFPRIIMGHKGTVQLLNRGNEEEWTCSLLTDGWQRHLDEWLISHKRTADVAI